MRVQATLQNVCINIKIVHYTMNTANECDSTLLPETKDAFIIVLFLCWAGVHLKELISSPRSSVVCFK